MPAASNSLRGWPAFSTKNRVTGSRFLANGPLYAGDTGDDWADGVRGNGSEFRGGVCGACWVLVDAVVS